MLEMKSANAITILTYISERWQRTLAINAFEFAIPSPAKDKLSLPVAAAEYPATIYPPPDQAPYPTSRVKALSVIQAQNIFVGKVQKGDAQERYFVPGTSI
jgi:hypothetical protein